MQPLNKSTIEILKKNRINVNEALTTFFILEYGLEKDNMIMNDNMINILSMNELIDYNFETKLYKTKIPLFDEKTPKIDWEQRFPRDFLMEYVKLFKSANLERGADTQHVRNKLINLITKRDNTVTNEEIMQAAKLYIARTLQQSGSKYVMKADMFILHNEKGYSIMPYIEEIREHGGDVSETKTNPFNEVL